MTAPALEPEFAWLITEDHLDGIKAGMMQPAILSPEHVNALMTPSLHLYPFTLEGPDGELLYRGVGHWPNVADEGTEPGLGAPLRHHWTGPVERIVWPDFPEDTEPALFNLDVPGTRPPAPIPDRLAHLLDTIRDLALMLPRAELEPRIAHNPELSPAERAAALAELDRIEREGAAHV